MAVLMLVALTTIGSAVGLVVAQALSMATHTRLGNIAKDFIVLSGG
ncbi:MAG: hypothetical protein M3Y65_07560 [Pseudomonadota bacterium]|nr:hypothetical protein [Pseudomonadota bacterium]